MRDAAHRARVKAVLDAVRATCDAAARREKDPVSFVHRFAARADRELVGLLAASLAFGNVTTIRQKLEEVLERLDRVPGKAASIADRCDDLPTLLGALEGFVHRLFRGEDVARLLYGARVSQREQGSLEVTFGRALERARIEGLGETELVWEAAASLVDAIRTHGGLDLPTTRRGPRHLLPDLRAGGGGKRFFLFLRWMVRAEDGIDLGVWRVPARLLECPVDTHILKLGRNLGLTARKDAGKRTVQDITRALRLFDADDPVKYDFSLCHLGMSVRCRERFVPEVCSGCAARDACRHARKADSRANPGRR
jgi:uncharacterized protein (TIGR02757 family)